MISTVVSKILCDLLNFDCSLVEDIVHHHSLAKKNCLFIALKGPNVDSRLFAKDALDAGALVVCDKVDLPQSMSEFTHERLIFVEDTNMFIEQVMQNLCTDLKKLGTKIVCITGTSGKTTTKVWMTEVLQSHFKDMYTIPSKYINYNSDIIGPLVFACSINKTPRALIFEIGISKAGDMDKISKVIQPNVSIITNIEYAHIGNFTGVDKKLELIKEKFKIIEHTSDLVITNERLKNSLETLYRDSLNKAEFFGSNKDSDASIQSIDNASIIKTSNDVYKTAITKYDTLENIAAIMLAFEKLYPNDCKDLFSKLVEKATPLAGRGKLHKNVVLKYNGSSKTIDIIDSSYNANGGKRGSMYMELQHLNTFKPSKKVAAVLGEMRENGDFSKDLHQEMLEAALNIVDKKHLFLIGKSWRELGNDLNIFEDDLITDKNAYAAYSKIFSTLEEDMICLVKSSFGVGVYKYLMPLFLENIN